MQLGIQAATRQQFGLRSQFHQPALVQHRDAVAVSDGGQAMGDDDGRAALHQAVHGLLHQALAFGVERAGGLVQNEQRRVAV